MQSGRPLSKLRDDFQKLPNPYATFQKKMIWLNRDDDDLMQRITWRTQRMIDGGMIEETKRAMQNGIENHPSLSESVGYREVIHFIKNGGEKKEMIHSIIKSTRQLVSKQRKWFRKHFPDGACLHLSPEQSIRVEDLPWVSGT